MQQMALQQKATPKREQRICNVCNDLNWQNFGVTGCLRVTFGQVQSAAQRGCDSCALIIMAIAEFGDSLAIEHQENFKINNIQNIDIYVVQGGKLSLDITFNPCCAHSSSMSLEFFSLSGHCTWPAIGESVCIPAKLDLPSAVTTVNKWIENCNLRHAHCKLPVSPLLPSRVLDLGHPSNRADIKLVCNHGISASYSALSYCWGKQSDTIQTTTSSIAKWAQNIPWVELPKTFQDAITLTWALGIRYLWIDALCILQDDKEDWEKESANMATIYSNSCITIAATAGTNTSSGLFPDRWTRAEGQQGLKLSIKAHKLNRTGHKLGTNIYIRPRLHLGHSRFRNMENAADHAEDAPLLTRAWAFQERLLPPRTVHFHAEELIWECKSCVQCECGELDRCYSYEKCGMKGWLKNFVTGSLHDYPSDPLNLGRVWLDIVSEFSRLELTNESDRLPALSGLACMFSKSSLGTYVVGLWENDLAKGLLFEKVESNENSQEDRYQPSAPTWSWASIYLGGTNAISYRLMFRHGLVQDQDFKPIKLYHTAPRYNHFSWISESLLELQGRCAIARFIPADSNLGLCRSGCIVLDLRDAQHIIASSCFKSDGRIEPHKTDPLVCMLIGSNRAACGDLEFREYALVFQRAPASRIAYKRVGFVMVDGGNHCFKDAPVATLLIL